MRIAPFVAICAVVALTGLARASAAPTVKNDYPTSARADYVLAA